MNPGDSVSHYRLVSRLGGGGMGVVWLAEDLPDCSNRRPVPVPPIGRYRWTKNGDAIAAVLTVPNQPQNIWVCPLDGSLPRQITHFTDPDQIGDSGWSHDGRRLAVLRRTTTSDIVLFKGLKK